MADKATLFAKEAEAKATASTFGSMFGFAPSKQRNMEEAGGKKRRRMRRKEGKEQRGKEYKQAEDANRLPCTHLRYLFVFAY